MNSMHFESYLSIDFLIYVMRWILSAFVMMVPLYFINKFNLTEKLLSKKYKGYKEYLDLIIIQIIGAFIFWWIDQMIFK